MAPVSILARTTAHLDELIRDARDLASANGSVQTVFSARLNSDKLAAGAGSSGCPRIARTPEG
jgi:hypothetical protein